MPTYLVSLAATVEADGETEAKSIAMELMKDDDIWFFNPDCHAVIEKVSDD